MEWRIPDFVPVRMGVLVRLSFSGLGMFSYILLKPRQLIKELPFRFHCQNRTVRKDDPLLPSKRPFSMRIRSEKVVIGVGALKKEVCSRINVPPAATSIPPLDSRTFRGSILTPTL